MTTYCAPCGKRMSDYTRKDRYDTCDECKRKDAKRKRKRKHGAFAINGKMVIIAKR